MTDGQLATAGLAFHDAGCAVLPTRADGSKAPGGCHSWTPYQKTRPTRGQVENWLTSGAFHGFGIITGAVSRHLEMLELEGRAVTEGVGSALADLITDAGLGDLWDRVTGGYLEHTPSGGIHLLYRVTDAPALPNTKLAERPARDDELTGDEREVRQAKPGKVFRRPLIETRGEGGYVVVAPSNGTTHPSGQPWRLETGGPTSIAAITAAERDALHQVCRALDQMPEPQPEPERAPRPPRRDNHRDNGRLTPGDDYNTRARWSDILGPHGWTHVRQAGNTSYWRRPGKNLGISATTGRNDGDNLYVFSTSTEFDSEKPYSKFAAHALLEHNGDFSAAARTLARQGYGDPLPERQPIPQSPDQQPHWVRDAPDDEPSTSGTANPTDPHTDHDPHDDEAFWTARPALDHIRRFARARYACPWSVLGTVLARIATATPPFVVLPALVGGHGSLNLFIGLVGASGDGKGASEAAARDAVDVGVDLIKINAGSGEGIAHMYLTRTKDGIEQHNHAVLFDVAEVDTLGALGDRRGSTLLPELRKAWSGETLGFAYVDPNKRLPLPAHKYRLTMTVGIQPDRAAGLLDDHGGGTPQRFVWLPVTDPHAPDNTPPEPTPLLWQRPTWPKADPRTGRVVLPVCDTATDTIRAARLARLRGEKGEGLDGHLLYTHLKVAAVLAILDERVEVTDDDWKLAETLMAVSARTRHAVVAHLHDSAAAENRKRATAKGLHDVAAEQVIDEERTKTVCTNVLRRLRGTGGEWVARNELRRRLKASLRDLFDPAVERLMETGQVESSDTARDVSGHGGKGIAYRLTRGAE